MAEKRLKTGHTASSCVASGGSLPSCTVVVCTQDRPSQLDQCLKATRDMCYPNLEVVVVDNGTENSATQEVAERWDARYVREPRVGLSRARNCGTRNCASEIVAFIDDDAVPKKDWLCNLIQDFADPNVFAVTGPIYPLTYTANGEIKQSASYVGPRRDQGVFDLSTPDWFTKANFGGIGDGSNMAFRLEAFRGWRGFHESLGRGTVVHGSEEHYAFFELIRRGYRVACTPRAIVYHPFPDNPDDARNKSLRNLAAATAYICFFFLEQPEYRGRLLRFVARAGFRRILRRPKDAANSAWREMKALASGPAQYLRSRRAAPSRFDRANQKSREKAQYELAPAKEE